MTKLLEGGTFSLMLGKKAMYEISKAAMFIILFPELVLLWKNIPKFKNPRIIVGRNKLMKVTKALL
jgi:hypothetical protein